ncbi:DNA phosphorothioation-dependent restriction protein DptG [Sporosarcina ureae]|uniref:DNA phosphorothioation-dependent restriction protein DptG n=1 Tax=Sporosarcina ureae TaxID=1571 RepID=A0ABM6JVC3_SPOUR|nr:DNA phosphorothioation-dependent restriction protein DptG [Sporosarcina ureae]ARF14009.1 hypothetical protein SporoS204_07530 [Sporosarcina ureae]
MNNYLEIDTLKKLYENNHSKGKVTDVLPFISSKTPKYNHLQWMNMIGELVKLITKVEVNYKNLPEDEYETNYNSLSLYVAESIECDDSDTREDLNKFIDEYLFNNTKINIVHPFLFNFISSEKTTNEENKYANFAYDVLLNETEVFSSFFNTKVTTDILNETIVNTLSEQITEKQKPRKPDFLGLIEDLSKLFTDDLKYLMKNTQYFNDSLPLLTNYYVFNYCCQLIYNFGDHRKDSYDNTKAFYYSLEWESLKTVRKAASGEFSYRNIKERAKLLFPQLHAQFQLSHSIFNLPDESDVRPFLTFSALRNKLELNDISEDDFMLNLHDWIKVYCEIQGVDQPDLPSTLNESLRTLTLSINKGMSQSTVKRYSSNIENIGKGVFLKSRGSLGFVFNLSHDLLMLLITVCVRDQRIPLKNLYIELEKRGISLDFSSKRELVKMLETHNLLDKKSDSGDAQYVKPIQ